MLKQNETVAPVFSVVVPVYNAERYLNKALQSILDQDFPDFERIPLVMAVLDASLQQKPLLCWLKKRKQS